jgi:hypothetical protein
MAWIPSAEDLLKAAEETVSGAVESGTEAVAQVAAGVDDAVDAATTAAGDAVGAAAEATGDAVGSTVEALEDHPATIVGGVIGGALAGVAGPGGALAGAAVGAGIGYAIDDPSVVPTEGAVVGAAWDVTDAAIGATVGAFEAALPILEATDQAMVVVDGALVGGLIGGVAGPGGALAGAAVGAGIGYAITEPDLVASVENAASEAPTALAETTVGAVEAALPILEAAEDPMIVIDGALIGGAIGGVAGPGGAVVGAAIGAGIGYVVSQPELARDGIAAVQAATDSQALTAEEGVGPTSSPDLTVPLSGSFGEGRADTPAGDAGAETFGSSLLSDSGVTVLGESGVGGMQADDAGTAATPGMLHGQGLGREKHAERRLAEADAGDGVGTTAVDLTADTADGIMDIAQDMSEDGLDQATDIANSEIGTGDEMTEA